MNRYTEYLLSTYVYYKYRNIIDREESCSKKSILLICRHPLGDTVVESPFIRAVRIEYPDHYIMMICSPENYNLLEKCPYVDEVIPYGGQVEGSFYKAHLKKAYKFAQKHYVNKKFDLAIISCTCMPALIEAWLAYFTGAERRLTFTERLNAGMHREYMGAYDRYFTDVLDSIGEVHEVENNNAMLHVLGIIPDNNGYELWLDNEDRHVVDGLWKKKGIDNAKLKIIVNLSTSCRSKDWPVERYIEVCSRIIEEYNVEYILIGAGKSAREYGDEFLNHINAHDFINATTIRQTAALLERADMYLGGDTGPMHMSAAAGLSGVAIYKSGENTNITFNFVKRLYPWKAPIIALHPKKAISGCELDGCSKSEAHCIKQVEVLEVYDALKIQIEDMGGNRWKKKL